LDEIANRQINFKDQVTGAFDSIEGSLVTLVSSTGSAKDKFKQFCQDVTNTILKSMTQIIIKGLITRAIMGAIGLGGGGISVGSVSGSWASSFTGGSLFTPGGIGTFASGGNFKAGQTAIVGEQGPELVRFGSAGRVYNNNETKSMLGGGVENVKVEVINQSGQEVKADNASVKFDGKTMIISTVIEAVNTNYMGMRSMLKGVATT
jgi:lambda family phage tail tape measure protein